MAVSTTDRSRPRPLLTPAEVAAILRVTPRTVRRYGAAGMLERVSIGGRIRRYTAESVEALVDPHHDESPAGNRALEQGGRDGAHGTG